MTSPEHLADLRREGVAALTAWRITGPGSGAIRDLVLEQHKDPVALAAGLLLVGDLLLDLLAENGVDPQTLLQQIATG